MYLCPLVLTLYMPLEFSKMSFKIDALRASSDWPDSRLPRVAWLRALPESIYLKTRLSEHRLRPKYFLRYLKG